MRFTLIAALFVAASPAYADGFTQPDLTKLVFDRSGLSAGEWIDKSEPSRITLMCLGCDHAPVLDVQTGRQDDGTEARVRSGETTIAMLDERCKARDPGCSIEGLEVAPAVGWISSYQLGSQFAHTVVVLRDGDLLTIRAMAEDATTARASADAAVAAIVPAIVGD